MDHDDKRTDDGKRADGDKGPDRAANGQNGVAHQLQARASAHPFWYHTIDIAPGVVTPGWFDLRPVAHRIPWPDVAGKRCLDIGTFDGYFAFELERRGAAEVVAIDVEDHLQWDWPPDYRGPQLARDPAFSGPPKGAGFRLAKELIGSNVDWRPLNVYDLHPALVGSFDVVVMGSLLIHLRDPIRALEAIRGVTRGQFLSSDQIELGLTWLSPHRPLYRLNGSGSECQWYNFNASGHCRLLYSAGFEIQKRSKPYSVRFNKHPLPTRRSVQTAATWALTGSSAPGVLHQALLARPRV
ncbi:MAG: class I SAM-dependent methyltransferase, partial [Acidimicrobiales bacterium]